MLAESGVRALAEPALRALNPPSRAVVRSIARDRQESGKWWA